MRAALQLLSTCVALWLLTFLTRKVFLPGVAAIADADQSLPRWAVEAASLLTTIENVVAFGGPIVIALAIVGWLRNRERPMSQGEG